MKLHDRRTASTSLSAKVIEYLRKRGFSQADIARMLHVSEGYVSLVKQRERGLTLDHLELLAMSLSMPLGAMLLAVSKPARISKRDAAKFRGIDRLIRQCDRVVELILKDTKRSKRKSA